MDAATTIRRLRQRSGLSLRALARRAGTSHATLSAYESGRKVPSVDTLDRIARAAGFDLDVALEPRLDAEELADRGDELAAVLDLAEQFPARHRGQMTYPKFGPIPAA